MKIQHYGRTLEGITLSIGIVAYPEHGTMLKSLIHAADAALYRANESGRNRTLVAEC